MISLWQPELLGSHCSGFSPKPFSGRTQVPTGKDFVLPQTEQELGASVWRGLGGGTWGRQDTQGQVGGPRLRQGSPTGTPGNGVRGARLAHEAPSVESGDCRTRTGSHASSCLCALSAALPFYSLLPSRSARVHHGLRTRVLGLSDNDFGWMALWLASRSVTGRVEADGKV